MNRQAWLFFEDCDLRPALRTVCTASGGSESGANLRTARLVRIASFTSISLFLSRTTSDHIAGEGAAACEYNSPDGRTTLIPRLSGPGIAPDVDGVGGPRTPAELHGAHRSCAAGILHPVSYGADRDGASGHLLLQPPVRQRAAR